MISERDLRLAKAIVDPYIGQDIIATAVLGTKLGSMLNENAYREVVNNAQRLIDGTECIPQGKTLEFILRKRYVETIKADRKSDLSLSKMRGLLKGNRAVARDDCEHFAGAISTRRHTVISNTPHVSSTSVTADFEKGSARMPAQPKTSLKGKSSISTTATSSRMRTDRIRRKSPQKGFGMNSGMSV